MQFVVRLVELVLTFATLLSQVQGQRAPFPVSDRNMILSSFREPNRCPPRNSLYNGSPYYPNRSHYTARGTMDCCYSDNTRQSCCLASYYGYDRRAGYVLKYECRCDPAVTCDVPPPCPTLPPTPRPTMPPTTPGPKMFCPSYDQPTNRALNGLPVTTDKRCLFKGLAQITLGMGAVKTMYCQGVYTKATVNGQVKDAFVTSHICVESVRNLLNTVDFTLNFNDEDFTVNNRNFDLITGSGGAAYFVPKFVVPEGRTCQHHPACPYDPSTGMPDLATLTDCSFVSYGAVNARRENNGLNEVPVKLSPRGCANQIAFNNNAITNGICFASKSDLNIYCTGDLGAPVYCKIPETGEIVFIGNAADQENCDTDPDLLVIPFTG